MKLLRWVSGSGGCPEGDTLAAFDHGELDEALLRAIGGHLARCRRCLTVLNAGRSPGRLEVKLRDCIGDVGVQPVLSPVLGQRPAPPLDPLPEQPCQKVGPYVLLELIGEGGMGVVYRAKDPVVGRTVALKMVSGRAPARPDRVARFRREGQALARLRHPNVVELYHFDEHDGQPYYTMELVEGGSLEAKLAGGVLPLREAAGLVRTLALAIHAAHAQQIIHRDLKPGNVLFGTDGTPKVADFGLAKVLDETPGQLTRSDAVVGTASYMPPEQAAARAGEVGPPADVYALGAMFYESLTGVPPYRGNSKWKTLALVQEGNLVPPTRLRADIPPDLEAVCLRCLAPSPRRRYPSAEALAEDLGRWLDGQRTQARRPGWGRRELRTARRWAVPLAGIILAAGLIRAAVALLRPVPGPAAPDGESEVVLRELESELDAGRPVTLVGATGWPKWFRWRAGAGVQRVHIETDGTFSAEVPHRHATGLLELLPDPRTDWYKLTAQVRHDQGKYGGFVGLYAGHRAYPRHPRELQFFSQVRFDAVTSMPRVIALPRAQERAPENHTHRMALTLRLHSDWSATPNVEAEWGEVLGPRLLALGPRNEVWHDLEVTVTPSGIAAYVNGNRMELPDSAVRQESLRSSLEATRGRHPADIALQNLQPEFTPRGGLGLVLYPLTAASVRGVTVTPLAGR